jgi:hypothetical protein
MKDRTTEADGFEDPYRHSFQDRDLADFVRLAAKLGWHYHEGNRCDEGGIKKVVIGVGVGVLVTVIGAFIIGGWALSNQVSSVSATMVAGFNEQNRRFAEQNDRISRLEIKTERIRRDEHP